MSATLPRASTTMGNRASVPSAGGSNQDPVRSFLPAASDSAESASDPLGAEDAGLVVPQLGKWFGGPPAPASSMAEGQFLSNAFHYAVLPKELQLLIISFLDFPVSACRLAQTCKHFRKLIEHHGKWEALMYVTSSTCVDVVLSS